MAEDDIQETSALDAGAVRVEWFAIPMTDGSVKRRLRLCIDDQVVEIRPGDARDLLRVLQVAERNGWLNPPA
jgi:hypothetical protein